METNATSSFAGGHLDGVIHLTGTLVLFVVLPLLLLLLLLWAVKRLYRAPPVSHPIGRTMLPTELPRGKERVLLVDDDPTALQVHNGILTDLGYKCHAVRSGEAAVAYLRGSPADIVLLDLVMDPGINGVETLRQIRQFAPKVRAILVTGYAKPSDVAAAQAMGAGAYLIKPVSSGMLATEVRRELDARRR